MARGAPRRRWIKLHCDGTIHGSVTYQLTEAEQAIWVKLLCLAGICDRDGQISDNDGRPFPRSHIAHEIHTTEELLESTIKKCKDEGRIIEDQHGLHITHWKDYQSEYQRQRRYRDAKKGTAKVCPECGWKGRTDDGFCPECAKKDREIELRKDYKGQKYGHMVQS